MTNKRLKQNGNFDFWTSSLQSCTSSSKKLFYILLWDVFIKYVRLFGGIRQYNVEIRKYKFLRLARDSVPLNERKY